MNAFAFRFPDDCTRGGAADTSTPPPQAPGATPTPMIHVVQANDTIWGLSQRYGVTVDEILAANGLSKQVVLQIGQKLIIPPKR